MMTDKYGYVGICIYSVSRECFGEGGGWIEEAQEDSIWA